MKSFPCSGNDRACISGHLCVPSRRNFKHKQKSVNYGTPQYQPFQRLFDTESVETSLEEVVNIIKCDAALRDRTEKHRYYLQQDLRRDADREVRLFLLRRCRLL